MTIRYEANPPKILPNVNTNESIEKFVDKIKKPEFRVMTGVN